MWRATVLTHWQFADNTNTPALLSFLHEGDSAVDVTGQNALNITPDPNAVIWEITCAESTLDAIEADANHLVLESEELVDG